MLLAAALVATGCAQQSPAPSVLSPATTSASPSPHAGHVRPGPVHPAGAPRVVAEGLSIPWAIVPLASGGALISERETALVKEVLPDGETVEVGRVPGVVPQGEGGLLGIELLRAESAGGGQDGDWLYAYTTARSDNRVIRMPLTGESGSLRLGEPEPIVTGIPKAGIHNGGRIRFGPDGMLYITTGDASRSSNSQDLDSLGGKILRVRPDGSAPAGNPFGDSPVWSYGHRNSQGLAWDDEGRLWASEFGQNTWDELNLIEPGSNYGWPVVEGVAGDDRFTDPVRQWHPGEASPSGIAWIDGTVIMACLRGQRIWTIDPQDPAEAEDWFNGEFGRLRDVAPAPGGGLWFITNDTGDDTLRHVGLEPA